MVLDGSVSLEAIATVAVSALLISSLLGVLSIAVPWLIGRAVAESTRVRALFHAQLAVWLSSVALAVCVLESDPAVGAASFAWLPVELAGLRLGASIDGLAAGLLVGVTSLTGIVQHFSFRYVHRDAGNARFFFLLETFQLGMILLVSASHLVGLIAGWELVGLSSTFLIAYFLQRRDPVESAMIAFVSYRICDVGLILGAALLTHTLGDVPISAWTARATEAAAHPWAIELAGMCFVIAAIGKSGQLPASSWLPRAMEGPTPSSAIFYGALSIHAGIYLLIRLEPLLATAWAARGLLLVVGMGTALYASSVGRVAADIKSRLAYAAMAQVGFMLVELALGWSTVATWHLGAHACWRTWQLLRAPSALHDSHRAHPFVSHAPHPGIRGQTDPAGLRWYARRLDHFGLEALVARGLVLPARQLVSVLERLDPWHEPTRDAAGPLP